MTESADIERVRRIIAGSNESYSLRDLARNLNVSYSTLSRFIRGGTITLDTFNKIVKWMNKGAFVK